MFKKTVKILGMRISLLLLVVILLILAAAGGLMLGYGILGGGNPGRVFTPGLWRDVMNKLNP
ncbi:DNA-directed RNA polymerase subunit beta [Lactococcus termiticola]|uniref:DNA-directed RNA polymerase subunit beta n=1 Tax=Lactococcus termiticola TaxID=2169526 RepID=A0A2R5HFD9_9LACT|nr:DNA-directed RNA polymerase subunit beta [Lactococcus termiticola]GBG96783.1 hypothetical protein NtB2_00907 [Lactococcus termiticola]